MNGASALYNLGAGSVKVLGGLFGAAAAPVAGPAAPVVEGASDWATWSGFWQATAGVEQGIYAATGSQQALQQSQAATTLGTVSGLLTYGATGNMQLSSFVGGFEFNTPTGGVMALVGLAETMSNVNLCK